MKNYIDLPFELQIEIQKYTPHPLTIIFYTEILLFEKILNNKIKIHNIDWDSDYYYLTFPNFATNKEGVPYTKYELEFLNNNKNFIRKHFTPLLI